MNRRIVAIAVFSALVTLAATFTAASGGKYGTKQETKKGILLVAFGTSVPEAQNAFRQIEKRANESFPNVDVKWAYTSKVIRDKLRKQGKQLDSPEVALAKMMEDGYTHVLVASFHTIPGEEFHDLQTNSHAFDSMKGGIRRIRVSRPLLSSRDDHEKVAKALMKSIPRERKPLDAVVFMGHGSEHHPADDAYAAINYWFGKIDPNVYVGTVEGQPKIEEFLPELKKKSTKKVYLAPLMSVAGDHARNDMCGDEQDSWRSILRKNGMEVECILKGTAEIPEVVDVWIDHMKKAFSNFE
ncbi:MAG: sirohydrochlorin cobaltochelatase [Desulfomonile tiedjei]|nr:sirohydrochlorin cobaltochelatase [Desulfomonile tiedjei]